MAAAQAADYPVMVSAAAFYRRGRFHAPRFPAVLHVTDLALDSAGFTAMKLWAGQGAQAGMANIYPWSLQDYVSLAQSLPLLNWWAQPDFCCEPEIAADAAERRRRIELTAFSLGCTLQEVQLRQAAELACYADGDEEVDEDVLECARAAIAPPVPVVTGWTVDDYRYSAELLCRTWAPWEAMYACPLIGIGSVCRRDLHHPEYGVLAILDALEGRLPSGSRVHLFGVKGAAIRHLIGHPLVASVDSMAYDVRARVTARERGLANVMAHRIEHMHRWRTKQATHLSCGDDAARARSASSTSRCAAATRCARVRAQQR
jgi:hypothetical protein